jgi:hypothetical protein
VRVVPSSAPHRVVSRGQPISRVAWRDTAANGLNGPESPGPRIPRSRAQSMLHRTTQAYRQVRAEHVTSPSDQGPPISVGRSGSTGKGLNSWHLRRGRVIGDWYACRGLRAMPTSRFTWVRGRRPWGIGPVPGCHYLVQQINSLSGRLMMIPRRLPQLPTRGEPNKFVSKGGDVLAQTGAPFREWANAHRS